MIPLTLRLTLLVLPARLPTPHPRQFSLLRPHLEALS
ncbi:MAG: hypothetical protein JWQ08_1021 [Deinococcus sp.]|nr:hypothetical protein [Deinococcus sp.]